MITCSSPLPFTLRSSTYGQTSLLWSPVVWPTPRPKCPSIGKSLQRRLGQIQRWWPMTPPRDLCCKIQAKSIKGFSTARLRPEEPHRSLPNISCFMWKVMICIWDVHWGVYKLYLDHLSDSSERTTICESRSVSRVCKRWRQYQCNLHSSRGARRGCELLLDLSWSGKHRTGLKGQSITSKIKQEINV